MRIADKRAVSSVQQLSTSLALEDRRLWVDRSFVVRCC
jgi:hypothetical protein